MGSVHVSSTSQLARGWPACYNELVAKCFRPCDVGRTHSMSIRSCEKSTDCIATGVCLWLKASFATSSTTGSLYIVPVFRRSCSCPRFTLGLGAVYLEPSILQIVHVCILWHLLHLDRGGALQTRACSIAKGGQQCNRL